MESTRRERKTQIEREEETKQWRRELYSFTVSKELSQIDQVMYLGLNFAVIIIYPNKIFQLAIIIYTNARTLAQLLIKERYEATQEGLERGGRPKYIAFLMVIIIHFTEYLQYIERKKFSLTFVTGCSNTK